MKHIVCYSGGHSSALVAIEVVRKYGKDNVILVNHECKLEDKDVARFENEVANYLGLPITYVSMPNADILDQFDVVVNKGSFINPHDKQALCTHVMKTEPFMNWLISNFNTNDNLFERRIINDKAVKESEISKEKSTQEYMKKFSSRYIQKAENIVYDPKTDRLLERDSKGNYYPIAKNNRLYKVLNIK